MEARDESFPGTRDGGCHLDTIRTSMGTVSHWTDAGGVCGVSPVVASASLRHQRIDGGAQGEVLRVPGLEPAPLVVELHYSCAPANSSGVLRLRKISGENPAAPNSSSPITCVLTGANRSPIL